MTDSFAKTLTRHMSKPTDKVVAELKEAERLLTGETRLYLVNYRVEQDDQSAKGKRAERYASLVARIRALEGKEWHLSTSAWVVRTRRTKQSLLTVLSVPLDEAIDFLSVTPIGTPVSFGQAKLTS